ncbi:MAG: IS1 family transposase [Saprospiraceae bacterium]
MSTPPTLSKQRELFVKVDEMWPFAGKKKTQNWLWWVEDAVNGNIIAFTFGRRTNATFRRIQKLLINAGIIVDLWITDSWIAYQDCLNRMEDKRALQSLEQKHLTLRTRIKRLTRRTICFSKSMDIHNTLIGLFINSFFFNLNQHV